ncbi:MAG: hypothetical protein Q8L48_23870 [Archangium sp.]|nr:hypothetical protein [Archangium sp.]
MNSLRFFGLVLVLAGCPKSAPPPDVTPPRPDAGVTEAELIAPKVDALEQEAAQVVRAVDEALWQHWTTGAPLDLAAATKGHDALFSKQSLETLHRARELRPADTRRIGNLERWLGGELLARGVAAESEALANLESSTTFTVDGKELPWRDLNKLLVSEKSAVKRRALWNGSHAAALRLEAAVVRRDGKLKEVLASLELPAPLDFAAETRGLDLDALRRQADEVLTRTDAEWKTTLQALTDADVRLPVSALTRGELPRLLKVPAAVDAEFPKGKIGTRAVQTLGTLGVYGQPGLTIDLAEAAKKSPLPLTVAPGPGDVRVSVKPVGGLRDQQAVLGELGAALTLHGAKSGSFALDRLGRSSEALRASELFASLLTEDAWLSANEVNNRPQVIAAAKAQRLFALRRAAGVVLARLETQTISDETAARAKFVAIMGRATGLSLSPEEGARWRLETDDFLRSAAQLDAMLGAEAWRVQLGDGWWLKTFAPHPGPLPAAAQGEGGK